ncbi:hypothetical protein ABIA32_004040 [Streptacidiphilus sp. MAP12-20]
MTELGPVVWPAAPIRTERLVLREPEARDRAAFIQLLASPEVHTYLGGPRPRAELELEMPEVPERWPGSFVVDLDGAMIGQILLRRDRSTIARLLRGGPTSVTCSCHGRGALGMPPSRARRHLNGSPMSFPVSRWCSPPRPPTSARCASRQSWGSPRWSGSRHGAPSSGSACGPQSGRPNDLVLDSADPRGHRSVVGLGRRLTSRSTYACRQQATCGRAAWRRVRCGSIVRSPDQPLW